MSQTSTCTTACDWLRGGLPGSRRGFVNRERRKAGLGLHSASLPLGEATPRHQREPREILPTMYRQSSAWRSTRDTPTGDERCSPTDLTAVYRVSQSEQKQCSSLVYMSTALVCTNNQLQESDMTWGSVNVSTPTVQRQQRGLREQESSCF